jgi:(p)ppGpp synthase/HD superfamily hydrolase
MGSKETVYSGLADAVALAEFAHRNQRDHAGMPYIDHPKRVLAAVQGQNALPYVQIAAVLHDVIEDTPFSREVLLTLGVPEAAVNLVWILSRNNGTSGDEYYYQVRDNPGARMVKLADIDDNMLPWRRAYLSQEKQDRLALKYARARDILDFYDPDSESGFTNTAQTRRLIARCSSS